MYRLREPAVDDSAYYDAVTNAKRRERRRRLRSTRDDVLTAYDGYIDRAPNLANLPALQLTNGQKEALVHAFEIPTAPMNRLRAKLTASLLGARCALCGLSETSELDHYLPKNHYPEFSLFSKNLVPVCAQCNKTKSDKILIDGTSVRRFLHVYFDEVPEGRFLQASLTFGANVIVVNFSIERPTGIPSHVYHLLRSHLSELDLVRRYQIMSLQHMSDTRGSYRRLFELDGTGVALAGELSMFSDDLAADYGRNHWLSVLNSSMARDVNFCNGGFAVLETTY